MKIEVFIEKQKDGDMAGKFYVHIGEECASGYKVYTSSIEQAAAPPYSTKPASAGSRETLPSSNIIHLPFTFLSLTR